MAYKRPSIEFPLSKKARVDLLKEYLEDYRSRAEADPKILNRKLPREAFKVLLDELGETLLARSKSLASEDGPVHAFLEANPLPEAVAHYLPPEFRVFCLALNAIKQWVAAEQMATDRYLLGGNARKLCREAIDRCIVSGDELGLDYELHHPVRDGRPAIPLSKRAHNTIEGQLTPEK